MDFGLQSATGVPRLQRPNSPAIHQKVWAAGRTLRGFSHTTGLLAFALLLFAQTPPAHAQASPSPPGASELPAREESWSRRLAKSHFERATALEMRGDIAPALREYTESLAIDSTLGDAYLRLGALRERMGDVREAELVYSEAVRLGDSRSQALLCRSHLRRAAGNPSQALSDLQAAIELEPSSAALTELARYYVEAHAWSAALATVRRIATSEQERGDTARLEAARLEIRALRVLAAETDPCTEAAKKHDWVGRALASMARR